MEPIDKKFLRVVSKEYQNISEKDMEALETVRNLKKYAKTNKSNYMITPKDTMGVSIKYNIPQSL